MKKLLVFACVAFLGLAAHSAVTWDWWFNNASEDISGCALGLGAANDKVTGAQVALCATKADKVKAGAQVAFGYCQVDTLRNGVQSAFVNRAESASLQLGLLCWNKTGFLPFFVFFNFDPNCFGGN